MPTLMEQLTFAQTPKRAAKPTAASDSNEVESGEEIITVDSMEGRAVLERGGIRIISSGLDMHIQPAVAHSPETEHASGFDDLTHKLREKHQGIGTHGRVLGGAPHIKGTRVSVAHILTHLYHLGSIDAVVDEFKQRISREQVQQALAYAHDFMEMACDPSEDDD